MKNRIYLLALAPLALAGCASDEPLVVTTTTTTATTEARERVVATEPGGRVATQEIFVAKAPPAVRIEERTAPPGAKYVWTRGYWRWTGNDYVWVSGSWVLRPKSTAVWTEGRWVRRPGGWVWIAGYWQ